MSTYGEKAVGLTFNPSGDPDVDKIKKLFAEIIDFCDQERREYHDEGPHNHEHERLFSVAITEAQTAQMWAIKAITWRDDP